MGNNKNYISTSPPVPLPTIKTSGMYTIMSGSRPLDQYL
jgi:hypothetical protein